MSFHEAAHAWAANRLGDPTARLLGRLTLNPMAHIDWIGTVLFPLVGMLSGLPLIGWAKPVPVDTRYLKDARRDFALVALAGPVSNLVLAFGATVLLRLQGGLVPDDGVSVVTQVLYLMVFMNVLLAAFNLLPVPPLDGGNVLAGIVPESMARVIDRVRPFGITEQGEPVEFFLEPGALSDTSALGLYNFDLPKGSFVTGDKAYNNYTIEDMMREAGH